MNLTISVCSKPGDVSVNVISLLCTAWCAHDIFGRNQWKRAEEIVSSSSQCSWLHCPSQDTPLSQSIKTHGVLETPAHRVPLIPGAARTLRLHCIPAACPTAMKSMTSVMVCGEQESSDISPPLTNVLFRHRGIWHLAYHLAQSLPVICVPPFISEPYL